VTHQERQGTCDLHFADQSTCIDNCTEGGERKKKREKAKERDREREREREREMRES
jgi:hypothetical protein